MTANVKLLDITHIYPCYIRDQYPCKELESLCTYHYYNSLSYNDDESYKNHYMNTQTYEIKWMQHIFTDLYYYILQSEINNKKFDNKRIEFIHKPGKEYFKNKFFKMTELFDLLENEWNFIPRKQFIRSIIFTYANQPILRILLKSENQIESPKTISSNNSPYIKRIIEENQDDEYVWGGIDNHISNFAEKKQNSKEKLSISGFLSVFDNYPKINQNTDTTDIFIDVYEYETKKNNYLHNKLMEELTNENSWTGWYNFYQITKNITNYKHKIIPFTFVGIYLGISIYYPLKKYLKM